MDSIESRFLGYFGEFLLSIFIFKLRKNQHIKIKELNASYILFSKSKYCKLKRFKYLILSKVLIGKRRLHYKNKLAFMNAIKYN